MTSLLDLQVVEISPSPDISQLTTEVKLWEKYPDACCFLNKVSILETIKSGHQVWVSGVRSHQTAHRSTLSYFSAGSGQSNILKCYPLLDVDETTSLAYRQKYQLPPHPLECKGFGSVGCRHCTATGCGRNGRWAGNGKTECGLHFDNIADN